MFRKGPLTFVILILITIYLCTWLWLCFVNFASAKICRNLFKPIHGRQNGIVP